MHFHEHRRHSRRILPILLSVLLLVLVLAGAYIFLPELGQSSVPYATTEHGWNLILVNEQHRIPKDWDPELTELSNGQKVDSRIYPDL